MSEALLQEQGSRRGVNCRCGCRRTIPHSPASCRWESLRAAAHGLRTRPLDERVRPCFAERLPAAGDPRLAGKLTPEREAELIALALR